jgi:Melibiase/Alpha galactosidase C-terminal beta sandwich domain
MKTLEQSLGRILNAGEIISRVFIELESGRIDPYEQSFYINDDGSHARLTLSYENGLQEDLYFHLEDSHVVCKRSTHNTSDKLAKICETAFLVDALDLGGKADDDYFYHVENPRIYDKMTIKLDTIRTADMVKDSGYDVQAGNRWADPGTVSERIGRSPYQPFPAIGISNYAVKSGLVHGTLSQDIFYHDYLVGHSEQGAFLDIRSGFKAVAYRELQAGETICDVWYLGQAENADDVEKIFAEYCDVLREHLPPLWGATDINRSSMVWGSWNDGTFRDIDSERLVKVAEFLSDNFPMVNWLQIDDGYAQFSTDHQMAHGLGMPYEGEAGMDQEKFPGGFKAFSDRIKQTNLRPAVWIGGRCDKRTKIAQEKPQWGADYNFRMKNHMVLDISQDEVREYVEKALDCFFADGGFEGMKHDFWSYAFEASEDLLKNKHRSGYEWREWWLTEIRKRIPDNGYLQTGCDIVMGNPFLAKYFTNYRYGIDIGGGEWDYVKTCLQWGAACFATHTGDLFVPNSDSVGLFPGLTDDEALLCTNYCLISRSMVEIAGWLHKEDPNNPRFAILKKAVCCLNNGQDVFFADYDYRLRDDAPEIWYLKTPHFSILSEEKGLPLRTIAFFNLQDEEQEFEVDFTSLGLDLCEYYVKDVWSGICSVEGKIKCTLAAHASALFMISSKEEIQLLDSNLKVDSIELKDDSMKLNFGYAGDFELTLSRKPVNMDSTEINSCFITKGKVDDKKEITIKF